MWRLPKREVSFIRTGPQPFPTTFRQAKVEDAAPHVVDFPRGQVAQSVEQRTENPRVDGSIPPLPMSFPNMVHTLKAEDSGQNSIPVISLGNGEPSRSYELHLADC